MICKGDAKAYVNISKLGSRLSLKWTHFLKRSIYAIFRNHLSGFGYGFMWLGMIYFLSLVTIHCLNSYIGQITWRRWAEFGFGSVVTVVLTWVYIGWNLWRGIFRKHTFFSLAYGFLWRFGSLLLCMWGKTSNKLHETSGQIPDPRIRIPCSLLVCSRRSALSEQKDFPLWVPMWREEEAGFHCVKTSWMPLSLPVLKVRKCKAE